MLGGNEYPAALKSFPQLASDLLVVDSQLAKTYAAIEIASSVYKRTQDNLEKPFIRNQLM